MPNMIYFSPLDLHDPRPAASPAPNWEVAHVNGSAFPIHGIDRTQRYDAYCDHVPWDARKPILFWRGSNAVGMAAYSMPMWHSHPRIHLVQMGGDPRYSHLIDAKWSNLYGVEPKDHPLWKPPYLDTYLVHEAVCHYKYLMYDRPRSCSSEVGPCVVAHPIVS
jgi:hypothetical protein